MNPGIASSAPAGHFLFGHYPAYARDPLGFLTRCAREHGDIVPLRMPGIRLFLINHPRYIETVMAETNQTFINHRGMRVRPSRRLFGHSLLTVEGSLWRHQRRVAYPAFRHERVAGYAEIMVDAAEEMLGRWTPGSTRDLYADLIRLNLTIVGRALFGQCIADRIPDIEAAFRALQDGFIAGSWLRSARALAGLPVSPAFSRAMTTLERIVDGLIADRLARRADGTDLLSMLMAARHEDGSPISSRRLREDVITFLFTGHKATAVAMAWSGYLLASHPDVQTRLADEASRVLGQRRPRAEDRAALEISAHVHKESMRLYPPGWAVGREAVHDCRLGDTDIPAGAQLVMSQWVTHRDPRFFAAPETFDPDRWQTAAAASIPKYAYYPHGGGGRYCLGHAFAELQAVLVLPMIARAFRLTPVSDEPPEVVPSFALIPRRGVVVRLGSRIAARYDPSPSVATA